LSCSVTLKQIVAPDDAPAIETVYGPVVDPGASAEPNVMFDGVIEKPPIGVNMTPFIAVAELFRTRKVRA
jgi:hypothetical protein